MPNRGQNGAVAGQPVHVAWDVDARKLADSRHLRLVQEDDDNQVGIPAPADRGDVLVLDNYRQTLVVIRSMARAGYRVVVAVEGDPGKRAFTEFSRSVSGVWRFSGDGGDARLCDALIAYLKGPGRGVKYVFPVGEASLRSLAKGASRFENLATLVMPDAETVFLCLDKRSIYERADALRIPVAPWSAGEDRAQWRRKAGEYGLPVIFKRRDSFERVKGRKALIIRAQGELDAFLSEIDDDPDPSSLVMQKYVPGSRHNCHVTAVGGTITAFLVTKTIRTDMPDATGYGVEIATVAAPGTIRKHCEALVKDLAYTGVCTIQFLIDPADPTPWLLEINPRLDACTRLPIFAGYDFPKMAIECASYRGDGPLPGATTDPAYPINMRAHWLYGDLAGLRKHRHSLPLFESLKWTGRIVRSLLTHRRHLTWRWNDPLPTLYLYYTMVSGIVLSLTRKLGLTRLPVGVSRRR